MSDKLGGLGLDEVKLCDNEILIKPTEVKNIASGKVAIIASGPSISNINFERLSGLNFFAVNGSTLALPSGSKDYSYYYAIDDHFVLEERPELVAVSYTHLKKIF
ncbi:hypothetical protein [Endozoicomonas sp.]|uniref:hypothetical protein n=1 Tax=Endozoicomonas sp. TaxID=1892382 RepID=UPI00383AA7AB